MNTTTYQLSKVTQADKELAEIVTRSYINSADTTTDLIYFTVEAYDKAEALVDAWNANHIEEVTLKKVRAQIDFLLYETLKIRFED